MSSATHLSRNNKYIPKLRMFSWALRAWWALLLGITVVLEVVPFPGVAPVLFYSYKGSKGVLFVLLGLLTPLTFWRFDSLGFGVLFSVVAAGTAEFIQSFSPGHAASYVEFTGKLLLLLFGFVCALNGRYDGQFKLGPLRLQLDDPHRTLQD
jgi:hypothetical protein